MMKRMPRRHLIQLAVVILIGWGVGQLLQQTAPVGADVGGSERAAALLLDKDAPSQEEADASVTLVVFTDYQCTACKRAHPEMEAAVASDGHVRLVYKDLPIFGALSEKAARIAIAADFQGIYPLVHKALMEERRQLNEQVFRDVVEQAGGNWVRLQQDLQTHGPEISQQIDINRRDAFQLGIVGTPAYLTGQILVSGAIEQADFAKIFMQARQSANR